jgi:predicted secreted protein
MMQYSGSLFFFLVTFAMSAGLSAAQNTAQQSSGPYSEHAHHISHAPHSSHALQAVTASLQASASKQVLQDEVRFVFAHEAKGNSAAEVNRLLAQAIEQARGTVKNANGFSLANGSFRTSPVYNNDGRNDSWQGRAELVLTSKDLTAAENALGVLGAQLAISSIQFSLSIAKRKEEEQALLTEAAQAFQNRAQAAALAFGFKTYKLISLDLNSPSGASNGPMLMRGAAPMSAPNTAEVLKLALEPAQVLVTVDISGKVAFD